MARKLSIAAMAMELMESLLVRKPATVLYPVERLAPPERFRGKMRYDPSDCSLCGLCQRDCPADVIKVVRKRIEREDGTKETVGHVEFEMDRCVFCGQCAYSCNKGSISFTTEFELAQGDRKKFMMREEPEQVDDEECDLDEDVVP
ncbi:MAG: 4Fe-4S dicluster domain-containing protein [Armatimonadota bacterium]|jgi:formate hydrogenlyase subunit 6/NADH:ubiquinone oxidoreductase subunit I